MPLYRMERDISNYIFISRQNIRIKYDGIGFIPINELMRSSGVTYATPLKINNILFYENPVLRVAFHMRT